MEFFCLGELDIIKPLQPQFILDVEMLELGINAGPFALLRGAHTRCGLKSIEWLHVLAWHGYRVGQSWQLKGKGGVDSSPQVYPYILLGNKLLRSIAAGSRDAKNAESRGI